MSMQQQPISPPLKEAQRTRFIDTGAGPRGLSPSDPLDVTVATDSALKMATMTLSPRNPSKSKYLADTEIFYLTTGRFILPVTGTSPGVRRYSVRAWYTATDGTVVGWNSNEVKVTWVKP